ncbi:GAF domain-containing protein [Streptomyces sp. NBC_00083]|uniref:GAF domain-containing protein n=1 Tax=Streptomyces sp. NBC_00083 TaxID=2975647 RepID=UPI002251CBE6|nr:GAF domain-containing protein [Streptomyces sp. NBC_00083]MCX5384202.1 GAF domain-containing protein [Streptomyces sp. NBC_00083]
MCGEAAVTDRRDESWVALDAGADPSERIPQLRSAHEQFTANGRMARPVRPLVAASWQRSARARVSPDGAARVELGEDDVAAYRDGHPLARVMPVVRELTGAYAGDGEHVVAVCDAQGRLLWVEGHARTRAAAARMNFVPGARWAESAVGTNAPGTALAEDRPVQVFSAEHFRRPVQAWTCAAAPVHDPRTGRLLGAVDLTGGDSLAHPHSLGFVQAVARAAEAELALLAPRPARSTIRLCALGRDEALFDADGRTVRLSRRHSEIAVLLACHPEGLTTDGMLMALYEDETVRPVTLRAELSRLRGLLGPDLLASRPYRLTAPVDADFDTVARRLGSGAVAAAMNVYGGPLLPGSQAPAVARLRRRLADQLRAALIARADPGLLSDWAYSPWGEDDLPVWRALAEALPRCQQASVRARLTELAAEQGLATGLQPPRA